MGSTRFHFLYWRGRREIDMRDNSNVRATRDGVPRSACRGRERTYLRERSEL